MQAGQPGVQCPLHQRALRRSGAVGVGQGDELLCSGAGIAMSELLIEQSALVDQPSAVSLHGGLGGCPLHPEGGTAPVKPGGDPRVGDTGQGAQPPQRRVDAGGKVRDGRNGGVYKREARLEASNGPVPVPVQRQRQPAPGGGGGAGQGQGVQRVGQCPGVQMQPQGQGRGQLTALPVGTEAEREAPDVLRWRRKRFCRFF